MHHPMTLPCRPVRRPWWLLAALPLYVGGLAAVCTVSFRYLGLACLAAAVILTLYALLRGRKRGRILLTILWILVLLLLLIPEVAVLRASRGEAENDAPYLIVLGAGVNGTIPSLSLVNRLTAAADYLNAHPDAIAIVSGGQGSGEWIPEAEAMYTWLVDQGIDSQRIVQEPQATSTYENLLYSFEIIRQRGDDPADGVAIVSSEYHLYRAGYMARKLGATPRGVAGVTTLRSLRINYFLREALAVWYMWLFGIA